MLRLVLVVMDLLTVLIRKCNNEYL